MNLGAEPKKILALAGLVLIGGYVFYANVLAGPEVAKPKTTAQSVALAPIVPIPSGRGPAPRKKAIRSVSQEFRPGLPTRPEDRPNYATVDPTLRLDLLAKVQAVEPEGGSRSIFKFAAAPPPEVKLAQGGPGPTIHPQGRPFGPDPPPGPPPPPPVVPPPPITLKFYGYSTPRADGTKRAFFLDGDDIFVASEGELIKKRYRVVQIGVNSVVMEDTQFKNNRQTLILQAEQAG
jgi:hypothetical protein